MGGCNLGSQGAVRTICFRPKHSVRFTRGRSPDLQVIAAPACLPIPKNSGLLRRPLAAYSGGTVRDSHPLPFSLAFHDEHLREFSSYHVVSPRSTAAGFWVVHRLSDYRAFHRSSARQVS